MPNSLYRRLFEDMDPHIVSEALVWLSFNDQVESLRYMSNEQRRRIVNAWSPQRGLDVLARLERWQDVAGEGWEGGLTDVRVMTGRPLPDHYPPGMNACAFYGNQYPV